MPLDDSNGNISLWVHTHTTDDKYVVFAEIFSLWDAFKELEQICPASLKIQLRCISLIHFLH